MNTLIYVLWAYVAISALYFGYAGVMNFKRGLNEKTIPRWVVWSVAIWLVIVWLLDVAINVTLMTLVMLEWPREATVSQRLGRLEAGTGWRAKLANAICKLLDPLDPSGDHCHH